MAPDGSAAFTTREETIAARDAAPVAMTIRSTRHGPVLSDILPEGTAESGDVLALSATFLDGYTLAGGESISFEITSGSAFIYGATTDNTTNDPSVQFARKFE